MSYKLRRPKPFLAGPLKNHIVNGTPVILANLYGAAAVPIQTVILIALDEEWQEIKLSKPGSNIDDFVSECNKNGTDIFSVTEKSKVFLPETPQEICERLKTDKYSSADIMLLYDHVTRFGRKSGYEDLRGYMKHVAGTVQEYVEYLKQQEVKFNYGPVMKNKHELVAEGRGADYEYSIGVFGTPTGYSNYYDIKVGIAHKESASDKSIQGIEDARRTALSESLLYIRRLIVEGFQHPDLNKIFIEIQNHLKSNTMAKLSERELELIDLGFTLDAARGVYTLDDFTIQKSTIESIEFIDWVSMIGRVTGDEPSTNDFTDFEVVTSPVETDTPPTETITLESLSMLKPDSISDLQGLKSKQEAIAAANPFVAVTDAKSLKKAKTAKAALLKASTDTEKIETNASKYLNTFKAMIKSIVSPAAQITRDLHQKQADEITRYEKAEEIRLAEERKKELEKINNRVSRLFAIPMVFNSEVYFIGTLYVTPSQIQTATDEEFESWIIQGNAIKSALDMTAKADEALRIENEKLRAEIEALKNGKINPDFGALIKEQVGVPPAPSDTPPVGAAFTNLPPAPSNVAESSAPPASVIPNTPLPVAPPVPTPAPLVSNIKWQPETVFVPAADNDYIMAKFDMDNMEHVKSVPMNPNFIKARSYFRNGRLETAAAIRSIMESDAQGKGSLVMELVNIIEQQ